VFICWFTIIPGIGLFYQDWLHDSCFEYGMLGPVLPSLEGQKNQANRRGTLLQNLSEDRMAKRVDEKERMKTICYRIR
jgi:hypothetical protein